MWQPQRDEACVRLLGRPALGQVQTPDPCCCVMLTYCSYKHRAHFALQRELHKHNFSEVMEKFLPPTDSAAAERAAAEPEQSIYDALLRSDTKMEVRRDANEPYHILQGQVILDHIPLMLTTLADWARRTEGDKYAISGRLTDLRLIRSICPPQLLRFATHFVLFLDEMRVLGKDGAVPSLTAVADARSVIISTYIKHLISAGHVWLSPPPRFAHCVACRDLGLHSTPLGFLRRSKWTRMWRSSAHSSRPTTLLSLEQRRPDSTRKVRLWDRMSFRLYFSYRT